MMRSSLLFRLFNPNCSFYVQLCSQSLVDSLANKKVIGTTYEQFQSVSPLEEVKVTNLEVPTITQPSFNFAAYINKSRTLQELLNLGVDLHKLEKRKGIFEFLLKLDFNRDVKNHLLFIHDIGVPASQLGEFISTNPLIFKEDVKNLALRICFLQSKNFTIAQISRIIAKNPFWLMFTTKRIDRRLGFFQNSFLLKGDDIRFLASKQPNLITYNLAHVRMNSFSIKEEMGFDEDSLRCLILDKPRLWMMNRQDLLQRHDYIQEKMGLTNEQILEFSNVLTTRLWRLKQRHEFLKFLGRDNYDCSKDLFVSPQKLVEGTDKDFVLNVANSTIEDYNNFLRIM